MKNKDFATAIVSVIIILFAILSIYYTIKSPEKSLVKDSQSIKKEVGGAGLLPGTEVTLISPSSEITYSQGDEIIIEWKNKGFEQTPDLPVNLKSIELYIYPSQWVEGGQPLSGTILQIGKVDLTNASLTVDGGKVKWRIPADFIAQWNRYVENRNNLHNISEVDRVDYELNPTKFTVHISVWAKDGFGQLNIGPSKPFTLLFGDNVFLAPNDGSLTLLTSEETGGKGGDVTGEFIRSVKISKAFYNSHNDNYDFLIILAPTFQSPGFDGNSPVKNDIQGIGKPIEDASSLYGSKGKLKSVVTIYSGSFLHEISHNWLMSISDPNLKINRDSSHWSQFVDTATREGGLMYFSPNGGNPFIDNGDGTFSLDSVTPVPSTWYHKFNSMELYLMGLIPSSQVQPVTLWESTSPQVAATMVGSKKTITIQDIVNSVGERNPAYPNTQRDFSIAYIIVPKKGEIIEDAILENIRLKVIDFSKEWNFATKGLSNIK